MHINAVKSYDCNNHTTKNQPSFRMLKTDYSAGSLIKKLSPSDRLKFDNIRKEVSKTKKWDLHLSATGRKDKKSFIFRFVNKKNQNEVIKNNFYPYKLEDNKIHIYTINSGQYENLSTVDVLTYKTKETAEELYSEHKRLQDEHFKKHWLLSPIENLIDRVNKLNILEKAYEFSDSKTGRKVLDTKAETKPFVDHI